MICQCRFCGRVRIGTEWVRDASVEPDVIGHCPPCGTLKILSDQAKYVREGKALLRQRAKGFGAPKTGEDVFKGFRGE